MGQSQGRMTPGHAAEMACMMDPAPGEDDHCPEMSEQAFHWMEKGLKSVAKDATPMIRASVVDLRAPARRPAAEELRALLASPAAAETYEVGEPECPGGFVQALLPGKVETDGWDNVPVSGYKHDICHPEYADGDVPYVELARRHPGDGAGPQNFLGTTADSYDNNTFAPLTTRAGGRVWSAYFAAPDGAVAALHAAYPCQILVRHDTQNRKLVLDVCDYAPVLVGHMDALYERMEADDASTLDAVATLAELKAMDRLVKTTRHKRTQLGGMLSMHPNAAAMFGGGGDPDEDEGPVDPLAPPPRGAPQTERIEKYGKGAIRVFKNYIGFRKSAVRRARYGLSALAAARVVVLDAPRPGSDLPPPAKTGPNDMGVEDLGRESLDNEGGFGGDIERVAEGLIARGAELEATAVLVLDFPTGEPEFAVATVRPHNAKRVACEDWTPGAVAGRATRLYIVGDLSEIRECADAIAARDPKVKSCLAAAAIADVDPGAAPTPPPPPPVPELPEDVVGAIASFAAPPPPPQPTCDDVHAYLSRAGIEDPESVNPCLKAGMLNGCVPMPADVAGWQDTVICDGTCFNCEAPHEATIRDVLYQPTYGGNDYGEENDGAVQCEECDYGCGMYVTGICGGRPNFDSGKFHNHCTRCPDFGQCIGDYREAHCGRCGGHYFAGLSGFKCPCRGGDPERNAWDDDGYSSSSYSASDEEAPAPAAAEPAPPAPGAFDAVLPGVETAELHSLRATGRALVGPGSYMGQIRAMVEAGGVGLPNVEAAELMLRMTPTTEQIDEIADMAELRNTVSGLLAIESRATRFGGRGDTDSGSDRGDDSGSDRGDDGSGSEDDASNATPDPSRGDGGSFQRASEEKLRTRRVVRVADRFRSPSADRGDADSGPEDA